MSNGLTTGEIPRRARPLAELTAGVVDAPADVLVSDITLNSREVRPGALFLAVQGLTRHGLEFAEQAITQGASAVLYEEPGDASRITAKHLQTVFVAGVPKLSRHVGTIADRFFDEPSRDLRIIGVTGTNGKTTCAYLIAQALTQCGRPAAYIGTLGFGVPGALTASDHTTSDAVSVHRQLASLRDLGATGVGMEVSSHALDQSRVDGVRFNTAAFTNLTHDHLDYHGSMDAYGDAKAKLFDRETLEVRVINVDDPFGAQLAARVAPGRLIVTSRAAQLAVPATDLFHAAQYVRATYVQMLPAGLAIDIESSWGATTVQAPLIGDFNVENVLTVLGVLLSANVSLGEAVRILASCAAPPGRMEVVGGESAHGLAIVDYAHTPDALSKALRAARAHCTGKLRAVFGCGGDRDAAKRPVMGRIAAELADEVILTDDNPRGEAPQKIVADILAGIASRTAVRVEHDRAQAIRIALQGSIAGDVVLIAGKGHEDYQIYGSQRRAFSDQAVVRAFFGGQA
jgi:UDP-N-acetylmuramoyl-L-alanyl-D-glutamate--2,6-diaminopimelate ligase